MLGRKKQSKGYKVTQTSKTLCLVKETGHRKTHNTVGFHLSGMSRTGSPVETESRQVVARGYREVGTGMTAQG